jgi:hypothetical protein
MTGFDEIRQRVAVVETLATALEELFDSSVFDGHVDRARLEHTAILVGLVREAAEKALLAVDAANAEALNPEIPGDVDPSTFEDADRR